MAELILPPPLLTDREWRSIADTVELPEAARCSIESAIASYRINRDWKANRKSDKKVQENLNRLAKAGRNLASAMGNLGEQELFELGSNEYFCGPTEGEKEAAAATLSSARDQAEFIVDWCTYSAEDVILLRSRKGRDASALHSLVRSLDAVLLSYKKLHIKRSKRLQWFVQIACRIADPNIGNGSIDEAMRTVISERGEIPKAPTI